MAANSKVVFCGDLTQVDNPYISPFGGLSALIEKFKGNPMFSHVTMERAVRSPLAELATKPEAAPNIAKRERERERERG